MTLYLLSTSSSLGWLDSPEFVAAGASLGVSHSPGHPLTVFVANLFMKLPLGDMVFRANLASAVPTALGSFFLYRWGTRFFASHVLPASRGLSFTLALLCSVSWSVWSQAVRAEAYGLQWLFLVGMFVAFWQRRLVLWGLWSGFALSNHHVSALGLFLPTAVSLLITLKPRGVLFLSTFAAGVAGLLSWAYLPARALTYPLVDWGHPTNASRFIWTLSGKAFAKNIGGEHATPWQFDGLQVLWVVVTTATPVITILGILGFLSARASKQGAVAVTLFASFVLTVAARTLLGFEAETSDHHAYLFPALLAWIGLASLGVVGVANGASPFGRRWWARSATALFALLVLLKVVFVGPRVWASPHSDAWAEFEWKGLPPRTVALTSYFQTHFRALAAQAVEGDRPDLTVIDRGFLTYPGSRDTYAKKYPELKTLLETPLAMGESKQAGSDKLILNLNELSKSRTVAWQLDPTIDESLMPHLTVSQNFALWTTAEKSAAWREKLDLAALDRPAWAFQLSASEATNDDTTALKHAVLWYDFCRLHAYCLKRQTSLAGQVWAEVRKIAPDDATLESLATSCGLQGAP